MKDISIIKRYMSYYSGYKREYFLGIVFAIIQIIITYMLPTITMNIFDKAIPDKSIRNLFVLLVIYAVLLISENICNIGYGYIFQKVNNKIAYKIRCDMIEHTGQVSGDFYSKSKTGDLMTKVTSDVDGVSSIFSDLFVNILIKMILLITLIVKIFTINKILAIVSIIFVPLYIYIQKIFNKKIEEANNNMYNSYSETATTINDYVSNLKIATIIGSKKFLFNKFNIEQINLIKNINKQYLINSMYSGVNSVINIINEIIVIAICGMLIISSEATLGMLMVFTTYSSQVRGAILALANSNVEYKRAIVMLKRIFSVLDEKTIEKIGDKTSNCIIEGEIEFKDVEFKYESGKQVLNGLNLNIKSNSCVGIVGVSGAGKSTLINLLFRLWDVNKGKIMIDGKNINSYSLDQLRSQYSVISQDIQLYNDTIMNNLVLDNKDIAFEEVKRACIKAGIYEYISKLPDGFESIIGENGTKLSGGQKQRISIARAILKNSPILILDEATSALDNISEQKVINNLLSIFKHKTTIIITHNLSTLSKCDNIYVLENGKVIESGTHNELSKNEKLYQKLIDVSLSW